MKNTELDGTMQLPDGRTIPVVVSLDLGEIAGAVHTSDPLLIRAVEVFGKAEKALSWLNSPNPSFGNQTPRDLGQTAEGREHVLGVLFDMEHGFPA